MYIYIVHNAHARVMKAENSITLTTYQWKRIHCTGMALRNEYGFSWIYLPGPWIHNQGYECSVHMLHIQLVTKPYMYIWVFLLQAARTIALCHSEHICDQVA